jgi:hypothetical protein
VRVLGDDGGATCDDPADGLRRATSYSIMTSGTARPGMRPVIADSRVVRGQLAVIEVYCPEELEEFQSRVDDLQYADVVND